MFSVKIIANQNNYNYAYAERFREELDTSQKDDLACGKIINPKQVEIHPIAKCINNCGSCIGAGVARSSQVLPVGIVRSVIADVAEFNPKILFSAGTMRGEPLLYPEIVEAWSSAQKWSLNKGIYSVGGPLITEKVASVFTENALPADYIAFNLSAYDNLSYNAFYRPLSGAQIDFQSVMRSIELLSNKIAQQDSNLQLVVNFGLNHSNNDLPKIVQLLLQLDQLAVDRIKFVTPIQRFTDFSAEEYGYYSRFVSDLKSLKEIVRFNHLQMIVLDQGGILPKSFNRCSVHLARAVINNDGTLSPCCYNPAIKFGNLHEQSFREIWFGAEHQNLQIDVSTCPSCSVADHAINSAII